MPETVPTTGRERGRSQSRRSFRGLRLVGGHPALDLVNTVKHRGTEAPGDRLESFRDVVDWAAAAGLISDAEARIARAGTEDAQDAETEALLRRTLEIREALWSLFNRGRISAGRHARARAVLERAVADLRPAPAIDPESGVLRWHGAVAAPADVLGRIVEAVTDLLSRRDALRIGSCDGCDCDWLFIDRSKAGRRRWCDTRICGNAARVRRHRATRRRQHAGP